MDFKKLLGLITSRKFLTAVSAILVVFGVVPEGEEGAFLEAILTIIMAVGYVFSVAYEDAHTPLNFNIDVEESPIDKHLKSG